jgi:hypothetical protein
MRLFNTIFIILCCSLASVQLNAQAQRFKAGIIVGFNASQLDGDAYAGYNKLGFVGGLSGVILLTDKMYVNTELLYSQRGSTSSLVAGNTNDPFKITANFIEIPLLFNYKDWLDTEGEFYKLHFHGGFSYGRLISSKVDGGAYQGVDFNKNDWSYLLGFTFYTGPHLAFTFRWSRSFGVLYFNDNTNLNSPSLQNHLISLRALYMF